MREARPFALWLLPGKDANDRLQGIIEELARRYDAVAFRPHVTLFAGVGGTERVQEIMDDEMTKAEAFDLSVRGVEYTHNFFKTLFIAFEENERLSALSRRIGERLARPQKYNLQPHLSLLYKILSSGEKEAVAKQLEVPGPEILFDRCCIVEPGVSNSWADIEHWTAGPEKALKQ